MQKKKIISVLMSLFILFTMGMATACSASPQSGSVSSQTESDNGTTLVYGSGDYTNINPALYEHGEINLLLFSGLTAHNEQNQIVPALAESWEYDADTCCYTFHLRKDVTFHDGEPFTSADVKFTIEAIQNPENASEIASNYEDIEAIETPDDNTVKIFLKAPNVAILDYLTVGMLPEHLLAGKDLATDEFNRNPVGTGPYRLVSWDMGQSIVLEKNPNYYNGEPNIDRIVFKIVPDTKTRAMQLKSGELDMAQVTPQDIQEFENEEGFLVDIMHTADYRGILYNFNNEFFKTHRELPNILSYAIDRQAIIDSVLLGHGQVAYSPLQAGPYNNPDMEKFSYDPQRAQDELQAAGWTMGADGIWEKDGQKLSFAINCSEGDQVRIDMANICAQQLREIGADVTVQVKAEIDWANQESYLIGWGSPFDPDDHTYKVFGTGKGSNFSGYSNANVDALLQAARETDDDQARKEYYRQFQEELTKDMPYTFIAYVDAIYVRRDNIQGITEDTVLGHHGVGIFWNIAEWTIT